MPRPSRPTTNTSMVQYIYEYIPVRTETAEENPAGILISSGSVVVLLVLEVVTAPVSSTAVSKAKKALPLSVVCSG